MTALKEAFRYQAQACADLGSAFMAQLCNVLATRLEPGTPLTNRLFNWPGDLTPRSESVPLRVCGALHALRLDENEALAAVYPPQKVSDDALWSAVGSVLVREADFIDGFIDSPPQTNEVRRSAVLIAIGHWLERRFAVDWRTSELGASAGLNLNWHLYGMEAGGLSFGPTDPALTLTPDWRGPLPPVTPPRLTSRAGVDLNPLDPRSDSLRLRAYLWPDQPERLALTEAAIALAGPTPDRGDAIDWLAGRLGHAEGEGHLIYSTVAWQYFPPDKQQNGTALIEAAGEKANDRSPLAWFGMENDGSGKGAALTLRLWPGDLRLNFGRADFHGRWVRWIDPL